MQRVLKICNQLNVPACAIFETDAPCLISQDLFNVVTVIELIVKTWGDIDLAGRITILNHNNVIGLEESTPVRSRTMKELNYWVLNLAMERKLITLYCILSVPSKMHQLR